MGNAFRSIKWSFIALISVSLLVYQNCGELAAPVSEKNSSHDIDDPNNGNNNILPIVDAGADQTITLPMSSANLSATATDLEGAIVRQEWAYVSGPGEPTIAVVSTNSISLTNLVAGVYVFEFVVEDGAGAEVYDQVQVIVNAPGNLAPVVDAGTNQSIILPTSEAALKGIASDSDGTLVKQEWGIVSGPSGPTVTVDKPDMSEITVSNLVAGVYIFEFTATDNSGAETSDQVEITVSAAANAVPVVNAGSDKSITLPTNSAAFTATSTDADGTIASNQWTYVSGPKIPTMGGVNTRNLTVTGAVAGVHTFRFTAVDNKGGKASDQVVLTVLAAVNQPPVVSAGANKDITLPINMASFTATSTDSDGTIAANKWEVVSGPNPYSLLNANTKTVTITGVVAGSYILEYTATDNNGAKTSDRVRLNVNAANNQTPIANAGADQTITLPTATASFAGTTTDADGAIASNQWTYVSGPGRPTISGQNTRNLVVSDVVVGNYIFQLTTIDNLGAVGSDQVNLIVKPAVNQAPIVSAGADKAITLPKDSAAFAAIASDVDGSIAKYEWSRVSGPAVSMLAIDSAKMTVIGAKAGSYVFRVTVTDNRGLTSSDTVSLTVAAPVNMAPVVKAGVDKVIKLPTSSATFNAVCRDTDGSIKEIRWSQTVGPRVSMLRIDTLDMTAINITKAGEYVFQILCRDNKDVVVTDSVRLTVQ